MKILKMNAIGWDWVRILFMNKKMNIKNIAGK
jgi:hypothetical protein